MAGDALQLAAAKELCTCSLLANIGQLALAMLHPQAYEQLRRKESRRFRRHQMVLSASLMQGWVCLTSCATLCAAMPRGPAMAAARVLGLDAQHVETPLRHSNAEWSEWRELLEPHAPIALCHTRTRVRPAARQVFSEFI